MRQHSTRNPLSADSDPIDTAPLCEGRFVPFARLGSGSQGETLEAVDRLNGQLVAIKRFDVRGATSWKDVELAEREARVLSTLTHRGLANYVHHFEHDGSLYLVMERVEGEDLAHLLAQGKRFTLCELLELVEVLSDVFSYLHGQSPPIVHRDVKPSNLIKRTHGGYALLDFGSVRDGLRPEGGSTVVGTFGYMAPEQFQGRALPASDLYGLGATLLTLMTGTTPEKLPHRGLQIDVRAALSGTAPEPWIQLVERLLVADPDRRASSLAPWLDALRAVTPKDEKASASPQPQAAAGPKYAQAHPSRAVSPPEPQSSNAEWTFGAGTSIPFFLIVILHVIRVAIYLVLQVALPMVLTILSPFLGRSLRHAATDVARVGQTADLHLRQLLDQLARSGPLMMSRRPRPEGRGRHGASRPRPGKRRMRVGNFDVELPEDDSTEETRSNRRSTGD